MKDETIKLLAAIAGITIIEVVALACGIDGIILSGTVAVLSGLGGYTLSQARQQENQICETKSALP